MLARAFTAGISAQWATGDSVYGNDRRLRMWLEGPPHAYVLAVSGHESVWLDWRQRRGNTVVASLPGSGWTQLSAGEGAKGPRWYNWRWPSLAGPVHPGWRRWLMVRRGVSTPQELQASLVFAPYDTTWEAAVCVEGTRWTIEQLFEAAKSEVGLDHYEVQSWTGWYRHVMLVMWALALLTILRAGAIAVEQ
jgi:SRSO17 transposase